MRAAWYDRTGPAAEVLELGELEDPRPGPGEVLVRVRASGVNPADVKRRAGWRGMAMGHPRVVPHCDGAGEIVGTGEGVDAGRVGERAWLWNAQGGYDGPGRAFGTAAELIALPSAQAVPLPEALSFDEGACLGVPAMTAHRAVFADGPVEGLTVLVQGAGGAVGHFAVQFAALAGARVIGTAGSAARAGHARAAGAEVVLDRHRDPVAERVLDLTRGRGADRIVDVDFGANLGTTVAALRTNGVIAAYSSTANPTPTFPYYDLAFRGATLRLIQGFALPAEARDRGEAAIAELAGRGALQVAVGERRPLNDIASAHALAEAGAVVGNVVLSL